MKLPLKKLILAPCILFLLVFISIIAIAQQPSGILNNKQPNREKFPRCLTMEFLQQSIQKDPTLPAKWKAEGERQYQLYLQRQKQIGLRTEKTEAAPIIIPIVFHLVDAASALAVISDRDVIEQVEILNRDYAGQKMDKYLKVIPPEIAARIGKIPIKFVLA